MEGKIEIHSLSKMLFSENNIFYKFIKQAVGSVLDVFTYCVRNFFAVFNLSYKKTVLNIKNFVYSN